VLRGALPPQGLHHGGRHRRDHVILGQVRLDVDRRVPTDVADDEYGLAKPRLVILGKTLWQFTHESHFITRPDRGISRSLTALGSRDQVDESLQRFGVRAVVNQMARLAEDQIGLGSAQMGERLNRTSRQGRTPDVAIQSESVVVGLVCP
jgi:hypothetical protein